MRNFSKTWVVILIYFKGGVNKMIDRIRKRFIRASIFGRKNKLIGVENISLVAHTLITPPKRVRTALIDRPLHHLNPPKRKRRYVLISP
jgi:hypothetical protein